MINEDFKITTEGYKLAKEYLKEKGLYERFMNNKTSTDGYSLVHYANSVKKKTLDKGIITMNDY